MKSTLRITAIVTRTYATTIAAVTHRKRRSRSSAIQAALRYAVDSRHPIAAPATATTPAAGRCPPISPSNARHARGPAPWRPSATHMPAERRTADRFRTGFGVGFNEMATPEILSLPLDTAVPHTVW